MGRERLRNTGVDKRLTRALSVHMRNRKHKPTAVM